MKRLAVLLAAAALVLSSTGCFEFEETIELNQDLSGKAGIKIGIDFEPMVVIMTQMKREMEGLTGPPTQAELAEARKSFVQQSKSEPKEDPEKMRAEIERDLPEGVKLLDAKVEERDLGMLSSFLFEFDKLSRLSDVTLPSSGDDPTKKNVFDTPFEGLQIQEKGNRITIRTKPQNPTNSVREETQQNAEVDPETEKMMEDAFKNLRVSYRITAPFEVIEHNATRVEGKTLIWEYDLETFKKMEKSKKPVDTAVMVTFRK